MAFERPFPIPPETAIASYDFEDISSGTGIIDYYAGESASGAYTMSNIPFYSNRVSTFAVAEEPTADFKKYGDIDYDVLINKPLEINGNVLINLTSGWNEEGGGSNTCVEYIVATLKKVDVNNNIITLGTDTSSQKTTTGGTGFQTRAMSINLSNEKIKKGETIRLNIQHYLKKTAGSDTILAGWGQDPKDRNDDYVYEGVKNGISDEWTTQFKMQLPVKINL